MFLFYIMIALIILVILVSYVCYRMAFYVKRVPISDEIVTPSGEIYDPFRDDMIRWIEEARKMNL